MKGISIANSLGFLLGCLALMGAGDKGLNIRVSPNPLLHGNSTSLTCRVTPDKKNRTLIFGIAGSGREGSERQLFDPRRPELEGAGAPITWGPFEFKAIPCDAGPAYCIVDRQGERPLQAIEQLTVAGCEGTK